MPIFAALGAICTVLDYSDRQLESERMVAAREGYSIDIVKADMTKRLPFGDGSFDLIFHPPSNCYIEDVYHVWNECFRVLKHGGVLLAGVDNGMNYVCDENDPLRIVNKLPYNPLKDPELYKKCVEESGGSLQFSHTLEEQIGGQLKAGFTLTDLYEDTDNCTLGEYVPLFIATRAEKG
jgi:SAM-dependent methyltransferase